MNLPLIPVSSGSKRLPDRASPSGAHWWRADSHGAPPPRPVDAGTRNRGHSVPRGAGTQALVVLALCGVTAALFSQGSATLLFLLGPLCVAAAFVLGLPGALLSLLLIAAIASVATDLGHGPIAQLSGGSRAQVPALVALLSAMAALLLPLRAVLARRDGQDGGVEPQFEQIARASTFGILQLDLSGHVLWANERWSALADTELADKAEPWMGVVAFQERDRLVRMWTKARATMEPASDDFPASATANARERCEWLHLWVDPTHDRRGQPTGFVVRVEDITARKLAERQLAESEHLYRLVAENVSDVVVRFGLDGTMLYVSSAVRRILGFEPEQLIGRPVRDLVHGEDWKEYHAAFAGFVALDQLTSEVRYRHRCADGSFRWVEGTFSPVFDPQTGNPVELIASIRDITRRHRTEQVIIESAAKLRESNRLISMAEDLAKVGHWRFDLLEKDFDYSIQVNAIVGVSRRDPLSARDALRLVDAKDRGKLLQTVARVRRAERACECEVSLTTPAGQERILRLVIQADRARNGRLAGIFGVVRDVTIERHATEELIRARDRAHSAADAKSNFLATMSHEIGTPMTGVLGMIDLLLKQPDDADRTRYLDMLKTSADLLMAVLDDILDFSRIDSGQILLERRDFCLDRLIEESTALFERRATEKGLRLLFDYDGPALPVRGDANRLRQVIANLLSNAIKFTAAGDIVVGMEATPGDERTKVRIEVADDGIGIATHLHAHLFDPFVQADASTSREYGGTGLGLAISRRLVEAMGGAIDVVSRAGEGATFRIDLELPTGSMDATFERADRSVSDAARAAPAHLAILVAEDNPVNQMLIGAMLRADGHHVTSVENGQLAVSLAAERSFDAIIMEMQMPVMDGLAATRAIRSSGGPCAATPILALTADASPERRRFYDGAGLSAFLTKPIDQDMLLDHLRSIAQLGKVVDASGEQRADVLQPAASGEATRDREPLIDDRQLAALRSAVGDARIEQLFDLLSLELEQRPAEILSALGRGDVEGAQRIAHSLKGAAGSAGALAVAARAARLEEEDGNHNAIAKDLLDTAGRTLKAIEALSDRERQRAAHG